MSSLEEAIEKFCKGHYQDLDRFLSEVPKDQRLETLQKMIDLSSQKYNEYEKAVIIRRIGHHPQFNPFFETLPVFRDQGIFYADLPFLKTRVHVSLFDHPSVTQGEIDYTCLIYDHTGKEVYKKLSTLKRRETHTFEVTELLKGNEPSFGMFCLQSAERDLHSMRIYAYWYNENSVTTTHEKKAFADGSSLVTCPTVVCNDQIETYIAVCNGGPETLNLKCQLVDVAGQSHPNTVNISFKPNATSFFPVSFYFANASSFLKNGPGILRIVNDQIGGLYYYFMHNKRLNAWQSQHL